MVKRLYIRKVREYCRLYNPSLAIVDTFSRYKVVILRGRDCFIHETEKNVRKFFSVSDMQIKVK